MKLFYKQVKTPVKVFQYLHFIFREFHFPIKKFLLQYDSNRHRNTHCSSVAQRDTLTTAVQHRSEIARSLRGRDSLLIRQRLVQKREPPIGHTHAIQSFAPQLSQSRCGVIVSKILPCFEKRLPLPCKIQIPLSFIPLSCLTAQKSQRIR